MGHISFGPPAPSADHPSLDPDIMQLVFTLYSAQLVLYTAQANLHQVEQNLHHAALLDPSLMPRAHYAYDALCQTLALAAAASPSTSPTSASVPLPPLGIAGGAALGLLATDANPDVLDYTRFKASFVAHFPGSEHLFPSSSPSSTNGARRFSDSAAQHGDGIGRTRPPGPATDSDGDEPTAHLAIPRAFGNGQVFMPSPPATTDGAPPQASYFPSAGFLPDPYSVHDRLPAPRSLPGALPVPRSHPYPSFAPHERPFDESKGKHRGVSPGIPAAAAQHHEDADTSNLSLIVAAAAAESASRSTIPTPTSPRRSDPPRVVHPGPATMASVLHPVAVNGGHERPASSAMQLLLRASSDAVDAHQAAQGSLSAGARDRGGSGSGSDVGGDYKRTRVDTGTDLDDFDDDEDDVDAEFDDDGELPVARTTPNVRSKPKGRAQRDTSRRGSLSAQSVETPGRQRSKEGSVSGPGGRGKARRQPRMMEYNPNTHFPLNTAHHFLVVQTKFGQPELSDRACTELFLVEAQTPPDSPYGRTILGEKAPYTSAHYAEDIKNRSVYTFASTAGAIWHVTFTDVGPTIAPAIPAGSNIGTLSPGTVCTFIRFPPRSFVVHAGTPLGSLPWWRSQACVGAQKHRGMPGAEGAWTARYDKDPRDRRPARIVEHFARCRWRGDAESGGVGGDPVGRLARAVLGNQSSQDKA